MQISWIETNRIAASSIPISEEDIRWLHRQGIRAILTLTEYPLTTLREITPALFQELDIVYFHCPVPDQHPPSDEQAHLILQFIREMEAQRRPVFIHCHAGIGRTGTILHLYYLAQGHSFEAARRIVRRRRVQSTLISDAQKQFLLSFRLNE